MGAPTVTDRRPKAFALFAAGYSITKTMAALNVSYSTVQRWRLEWKRENRSTGIKTPPSYPGASRLVGWGSGFGRKPT